MYEKGSGMNFTTQKYENVVAPSSEQSESTESGVDNGGKNRIEQIVRENRDVDREAIQKIRKDIARVSHKDDKVTKSGERNLFDIYTQQQTEQRSLRHKDFFGNVQSALSTDLLFKYIYKRFPEVAEGNDPNSDQFYLKKVDSYNTQQEIKAEKLGFDKKIAFLGHIHSRGVESVLDGSDGSLSPEEILEEYKKAVLELKEKGYDDVYAVLTDHNSVNNSIKLAEMMEAEGVAKPIIGVESTTKEGYEILSYTTDVQKLKDYSQHIEKKIGIIFRNAKSGNRGSDLIKWLAENNFVLGMPHPASQKAIMLGGTLSERIKRDSELRKLIQDHVSFYEGMNWFQDVKGSNCIAFNMREEMESLGVVPFANEDFHSKVQGSEDTFFNGMFTEIRTNQNITSGEDLLNLFRNQKQEPSQVKYVTMLRGAPATDMQYKEQLERSSKQNISNVLQILKNKTLSLFKKSNV